MSEHDVSLKCSICKHVYRTVSKDGLPLEDHIVPVIMPRCKHIVCAECFRAEASRGVTERKMCPIGGCGQEIEPLPQEDMTARCMLQFLDSKHIKPSEEDLRFQSLTDGPRNPSRSLGKGSMGVSRADQAPRRCQECCARAAAARDGKPIQHTGAVAFVCKDCGEEGLAVCKHCVAFHRLNGHAIYDIKYKDPGRSHPCVVHPGKACKKYCWSCQTYVCSLCEREEHRHPDMHENVTMEEALDRKRNSAARVKTELALHSQRFREAHGVVSGNYDRMNCEHDASVASFLDDLDGIVAILQDTKAATPAYAKELMEHRRKCLLRQMEGLDMTCSQLHAAACMVETGCVKAAPHDLSTIEAEAKRLLQAKEMSTKPEDSTPVLYHFDKARVANAISASSVITDVQGVDPNTSSVQGDGLRSFTIGGDPSVVIVQLNNPDGVAVTTVTAADFRVFVVNTQVQLEDNRSGKFDPCFPTHAPSVAEVKVTCEARTGSATVSYSVFDIRVKSVKLWILVGGISLNPEGWTVSGGVACGCSWIERAQFVPLPPLPLPPPIVVAEDLEAPSAFQIEGYEEVTTGMQAGCAQLEAPFGGEQSPITRNEAATGPGPLAIPAGEPVDDTATSLLQPIITDQVALAGCDDTVSRRESR